ncbi:YceI family protein [Flavobacterium terrae]|uniref:YceI-like domain-containing protein n=1 Tax=Flavobacterium terrae TaxID=415425 RepID=A0A1M6FPB0_9FLAO|nr:YceI family protein [Flavobacterium terrae]SHI99505.1 YceI-like domain-containing protein [Flavobacterium terrae]
MKHLLALALAILAFNNTVAQEKVLTKSGVTTFEASVPSFEEVKATNKLSGCILNTKTGEIVGLLMMKNFKFKSALMEEHFNENYMESDKYPKGVFKGKIQNFNIENLTSNNQDFTINGSMEIHGKSKDITITVKISKKENSIFLSSNFNLNTDDFGIELPILVRSKVAKKVNVQIDYSLK